jgi:hypothetical protein
MMRRDAIRLCDQLLLAVPGAAGVWNTMGLLHADLITHDLASTPASMQCLLEAEQLGFERRELRYSLCRLWSKIRDVRDLATHSRRSDKSLTRRAERQMAQVEAQIARLGLAPIPRGALELRGASKTPNWAVQRIRRGSGLQRGHPLKPRAAGCGVKPIPYLAEIATRSRIKRAANAAHCLDWTSCNRCRPATTRSLHKLIPTQNVRSTPASRA